MSICGFGLPEAWIAPLGKYNFISLIKRFIYLSEGD